MVDDRINHIPKEMPGRLVPDVQVPEDWFDDIGVVDERDDARRVAAQSVQLARHAAAIPAHSRVVSEQFEHFQQPASVPDFRGCAHAYAKFIISSAARPMKP